jgi:hypothetical protein
LDRAEWLKETRHKVENSATLTTAKNARLGIEHAIWAALVSGAMDGRALYWEDGFAVFFPKLS